MGLAQSGGTAFAASGVPECVLPTGRFHQRRRSMDRCPETETVRAGGVHAARSITSPLPAVGAVLRVVLPPASPVSRLAATRGVLRRSSGGEVAGGLSSDALAVPQM